MTLLRSADVGAVLTVMLGVPGQLASRVDLCKPDHAGLCPSLVRYCLGAHAPIQRRDQNKFNDAAAGAVFVFNRADHDSCGKLKCGARAN